MRFLVLLISILFACHLSGKTHTAVIYYLDSCQNIIVSERVVINEAWLQKERPNPVLKLFQKKHRLNKRITSAVLAFPFPFGIVGLHRIYLGTKPYVPVVYIASLGGVFGILPFIDFCAITFDKKNFEHYKDNGQVFMWLNH